jgi:hypothetical protein
MKFEIAVSVPTDDLTPRKIVSLVSKVVEVEPVSVSNDNTHCDVVFLFGTRGKADDAMFRLIWEFPDSNIYLTSLTDDDEDDRTLAAYIGDPSEAEMVEEKDGLFVSSRVGNA